MAFPPASGLVASGLSGSRVYILLNYFVKQKVSQEGTRHDVQRFLVVQDYPWRLPIMHNYNARDTASGAWGRNC